MSKKGLYFECYSGISGDMSVAALLDLGADENYLRQTLVQLELPGYEIKIDRVNTSGIDACQFDVMIPEQPCYDEGHGLQYEGHEHEHDHEHCHEHGHDHGHDHDHHEAHCHDHDHDHHHHDHSHDHGHCHNHDHDDHHHHDHHSHVHRNLTDVYEILDKLEDENVKTLSKKIFQIVAQAEAKAHNKPLEAVHFHEVGAIDSIVDVVSFAACFLSLKVDHVYFSPLYEGTGHVHCQHGILPVPAPATLNILANSGLQLHITDNHGEMITPTGAGIAAAVCGGTQLPEQFSIVGTGLGAGKKQFKRANLLRAMLIEE